jgi:hypothetical protein
MFTFTGNRAATKKSYVLLFDQTSQKATLEPLSDAYTFNLATRNGKDVASEHARIYPKKSKEGAQDDEGEEDLFGQPEAEDDSGEADPSNPYDFRHFMSKEKEKRGDESEYYNPSSPDNRAGSGSAMNTPQFGALGARKPAEAAAPKAKPAEPAQKKQRKGDSMFMKKKPGVKKAQPTPTINLERRASERIVPEAAPKPKPKPKAAGPPPSKIKSAELVHSSDESDADAEGDAEPISSPPRQPQRSPSPQYQQFSSQEDEDAEGESDDNGDLEIEVPDARSSRPRGALKALGMGQNLGLGGPGFRSPSNGPISLASATNSAQGSPAPHDFSRKTGLDDGVIDFGDLSDDAEGDDDDEDDGGELEIDEGDQDVDVDVEEMDIGPPARTGTTLERKISMGGGAAEEDEEDPLYREMMAGLAGGDSSEESEEE